MIRINPPSIHRSIVMWRPYTGGWRTRHRRRVKETRVNPLLRLKALGQSPWLDYIQRDLLTGGGLARLMREDGICGVTSNPTILARAVLEHDDYAEAIARLRRQCDGVLALYEALVVEDIRMAADILAPAWRDSDGVDGYVSVEVSPDLAYDTEGTVREAQRLWAVLDRPNVMIKVPATEPGLAAITRLTAAGVNVNATLIFSPRRYEEVARAWLAGIRQRRAAGTPWTQVAFVASFFVSRIETLADGLLEERAAREPRAADLRGRVAVAVARTAYARFLELSAEEEWQAVVREGGHVQRLLWASTSTKNPEYSDVKYVDELAGPQTVTTLPPQTLAAYRDHGDPAPRLGTGLDAARETLEELAAVGIDLEDMAARLEKEGVEKFAASHRRLLDALSRP